MKKFYQLIYKEEKSDIDRKELKELRSQLKDNREKAQKWRKSADLNKFENLENSLKKPVLIFMLISLIFFLDLKTLMMKLLLP